MPADKGPRRPLCVSRSRPPPRPKILGKQHLSGQPWLSLPWPQKWRWQDTQPGSQSIPHLCASGVQRSRPLLEASSSHLAGVSASLQVPCTHHPGGQVALIDGLAVAESEVDDLHLSLAQLWGSVLCNRQAVSSWRSQPSHPTHTHTARGLGCCCMPGSGVLPPHRVAQP